MAEPETPRPESTLVIAGNDTAPFVYCDSVAAFGINKGVMEIELSCRTIMPLNDTAGVRHEIVITGHLRCSPAAVMNIREAIEKASAMLAQTQQGARTQT
jgi:hypothetical protein